MQSISPWMHNGPRQAALVLACFVMKLNAQDVFLHLSARIVEDMPAPAHHHHRLPPQPSPTSPTTTTATTTTLPVPRPPSPNSTNVYMPQCEMAAPGWPTFNTSDELQSDSEWSQYFTTVYGEIPSFGYPICVGSFTQLAVRGGPQITANPQDCEDDTVDDGTLVYAMSHFEPPQVTHIYSSRNVKHAVPAYMWVEIQHTYSPTDQGVAWYFLEFGSAIWFNVGNTIVFKDHPDASEYFLGADCKDKQPKPREDAQREKLSEKVQTECEADFPQWYEEAKRQRYTSLQFTDHYDCTCGEEGPSSLRNDRLCHTEIVDFNAVNSANGCAFVNYQAGWAARRECDCDSSKNYSNCKGYGV